MQQRTQLEVMESRQFGDDIRFRLRPRPEATESDLARV